MDIKGYVQSFARIQISAQKISLFAKTRHLFSQKLFERISSKMMKCGLTPGMKFGVNAFQVVAGNVGINLRGGNIGMAEKFLHNT